MKFSEQSTVVIGVALGLILLLFYPENSKVNFDDLALGENTTSVFAKDSSGFQIHVNKLTNMSVNSLVAGWKSRGNKNVVLILGNSQTHAINQYQLTDQTFVKILHDTIENYDIICHSLPNANLQELYLSYIHLNEILPVVKVIIPVFFDDLREAGIRPNSYDNIENGNYKFEKKPPFIIPEINDFLLRAQVNEDFQALDQTIQERMELYLNDKAEKYFQTWALRPQMRGNIFSNLYLLRNEVFGITPQSKRKKIQVNYDTNVRAFEALVKTADWNEDQLIAYIPPIRKDISMPYDHNEYKSFKDDLYNLNNKYQNFLLENFESIVPGKFWGYKNSTSLGAEPEYDFMHFQQGGHSILADSLLTMLR